MKRGQGQIFWILIFAALALMYLYVSVYGGTIFKAKTEAILGGPFQKAKFLGCKSTYKAGQPDIDRDGCRDTHNADLCVFSKEEAIKMGATAYEEGTTDITTLIYLGNEYCDDDEDGISDICDKDPTKAIIGCDMDPGRPGKCMAGPKEMIQRVIGSQNCRDQVQENMRLDIA